MGRTTVEMWFDSDRWKSLSPFQKVSRTAPFSPQPSVQCSRSEWSGREAGRLFPSTVEPKKAWGYSHNPQYIFNNCKETNVDFRRVCKTANSNYYLRMSACLPCLSVCLSARPSAWKNSVPTGRVLIKTDTWAFANICWQSSSFIKIRQE